MTANRHSGFLDRAIDLAISNVIDHQGGPYGAVIVQDNRIIAQGSNRVTSSHDPTAHAEIIAIRNACIVLQNYQLSDCILYCSCEPCPMCFGAIYWARLKQVYFAGSREHAAAAGFDDRFIYQQVNEKPDKRKIPMHHIPRPAMEKPFYLWKNQEDKTIY